MGPLDGPVSMMDLENRDPNKHYVFVARHKETQRMYRTMGYTPESAREGGVNVIGDQPAAGSEIEACDHVLMSMEKSRHDRIVQHGFMDAQGQKGVDRFEKAVIDKRIMSDHFRGGQSSRHFQFEDVNISGLERE